MRRAGPWAVFAAGLGVVLWVAAGYVASSPLALVVLALITAAYGAGAWELRRMAHDTAALHQALGRLPAEPPALPQWLDTLPTGLRTAVARRVECERVALPGPALTPYLVGLLVLLGMLGTFLGMVMTLKGAVVALDRTADLAALRQALSVPVRGLGLAFGTSVAGVAASAALGLLAALARLERAEVSQALDLAIAGPLQDFSATRQRQLHQDERHRAEQQALRAQQETQQAQLLAQHADHLARQQAQHEAFLQAQTACLQAQSRLAPEMLAQWQTAMAQMQRQHESLDARLVAAQDQHHQQALALQADLSATVRRALEQHLQDSLAQTARAAREGWQPLIEATLRELAAQAVQWQTLTHQAVQQHLDAVDQRLQHALDAQEMQRTQQADLLGHLLQTLERSAAEQRTAVDALLASSATVLEQVGQRFFAQVEAAAGALASAGGQLQGGAVEVASLGEAFGVAVQRFVDATQGLGAQLQRVDEALQRATQRSDEQLAYYVGQARELIELSVASQKQVLDGLHRLAQPGAAAPQPVETV